jgi:hypothetical protein
MGGGLRAEWPRLPWKRPGGRDTSDSGFTPTEKYFPKTPRFALNSFSRSVFPALQIHSTQLISTKHRQHTPPQKKLGRTALDANCIHRLSTSFFSGDALLVLRALPAGVLISTVLVNKSLWKLHRQTCTSLHSDETQPHQSQQITTAFSFRHVTLEHHCSSVASIALQL